jgi:glycosyltransferase involved in cell wall biosynthesis
MSIWYDVSGLVTWSRHQFGGIERVTSGILAGLVEHGTTVGLVHVPPRAVAFAPLAFADLPEIARRHVPLRPEDPRCRGERVAFAAGDVLLSLGGTFTIRGHHRAVEDARCRGVRIVRLLYDLIPATKPQWVPASPVWSAWTRHVLERSDVVLAISRFTAAEAARFCAAHGLPVPPLEVIRLGDVLDLQRGAAQAAPLPRFVPPRPFFLCVSTVDVRKNHRALYEAWRVLAGRRADRCPDLVCVGVPHVQVDDLLHEIRHDRDVNRHFHVLHDVHDAELRWYYEHCLATIYPSKHEGWGLPVAESLGLGKLCIAAHATSMPEISADLPAWFEPHDVARLVALVERVEDDPDWLRDREAAIRGTFRPTTWRDTAAQMLEVIGAAGRVEDAAA